jgi:hypothetical protein
MPAFDPSAYRAAYYSLPREYRTAFATGFKAAHQREINEYRKANPLRPRKPMQQTASTSAVEREKPTALVIHLDRFRRGLVEASTPASAPLAAAA